MAAKCTLAALAVSFGCLSVAPPASALPAESDHNYNGANHNNERCVSLAGARIAVRSVEGGQLEAEQLPGTTVGPLYDAPERCSRGSGVALEGIESISAAGHTLYYAKPTSANRFPGFVSGSELARTPPSPRPANAGAGRNPATGQRESNGTPAAAASGAPYYVITPTAIEHVQCYAAVSVPNPISSSCTPNYEYAPYGQPTSGARYALMMWSWIEEEGGGIARAAVAEGARFYPSAVAPITNTSFNNASHRANGTVTVRYGYVAADGEQRIYGWMVTSHTFEGRCRNDMRYGAGPPAPGTLCSAARGVASGAEIPLGEELFSESLGSQTQSFFGG